MRTINPGFEAAPTAPHDRGPAEEDQGQTQKMEALGRVACGVAHDFNNLLTVISGYCQLLLARSAPRHEMRDELLQIHQATERAAGFTRQLLYFSSKKDCPPELVNLNDLVSDHARMLRPLVGDAIEVHLDLTEDLPPIEINPGQLLQVLMNLAANGRDAMPHGGRLILSTGLVAQPTHRRLRRPASRRSVASGKLGHLAHRQASSPTAASGSAQASETVHVVLRVTDTGCGMDESTLARLFEPFFTTKNRGHGTGLGLANVADIVKQMQGRIEVESTPGHGSSFSIYLPAASGVPAAPASTAEGFSNLKGSESILVVEDADYVRLLVERVLTMHGYQVLSASDGHQAISLAEQASRPIDLLITDMVMPRMSGRELGQALLAKQANLRVLYVSGYSASTLEDPVPWDPGDAFLQKPFSPEALLRKVREMLAKTGSQPG